MDLTPSLVACTAVVVACEVAKHLGAIGDKVKLPAGLINIPHIADRMHEINWTGGMLNLLYFLGLVSKQDASDLAPALWPLTHKEQLDVLWKLFLPERPPELQLTPEKPDHWADIAGSLIECGKTYEPSGSVCESIVFPPPPFIVLTCLIIPVSLDVFYTIPLRGSKEDWLNNQLKPWADFSRDEPTYTDAPGQHYTLMEFGHVPGFQMIFRDRLKARRL